MEEKLTYKQAIPLTKLSAGGTSAEAAKAAGVSLRTVESWKAESGFKSKYKTAVNCIVDAAVAELALSSQVAAKELVAIIQNPETPARTKIQAINTMFQIIAKSRDWGLEERLQALEDKAHAVNGKN